MKKHLSHLLQLLLITVFLLSSNAALSQGKARQEKKPVPAAALEYIKKNKQKLELKDEDIAELELSSETESKKSGVKHVYLKQTYQGIEIFGAITNMSINREGKVINMGNRFHKEIGKKVNTNQAGLNAEAAVAAAAKHLNTSIRQPLVVKEKTAGRNKEVLFSNGGISLEPIPAKLVYQPMEDGSLRLAWEVSIYELDAQNWWNIRLDANTGAVLDKDNMVVQCQFDNDGPGGKFLHNDHSHSLLSPYVASPKAEAAAVEVSNGYNVFAMPLESPNHGPRSIVSNSVANATASPNGWHSTGVTNYTITRGNNVYAYEDPDNTGYIGLEQDMYGYSPDGGSSLSFDYPVDFTQQPVAYRDAAITNLFYWNNIIHDVWYQYGFDEMSGNFQTSNYDNGGLGADHVMAEAQDSRNILTTRNNANFATPVDGFRPRMQMYLWSGIPDPDMFRVTSPGSIAGSYPAVQAAFGPRLTPVPVSGKLVLVEGIGGASTNPAEGCGTLTNAAAVAGNIAVVYRGACDFSTKVYNAQLAGAIAVVVINNQPGAPIAMGAGAVPANLILISSVMVSDVTGASIRTLLNNGEEVMVSLKDDGSGPEFDGDFDSGIIVHEYGHGISNRLTGGPATTSCLGNAEQGGEGWSDWFGLMMTMRPGDTRDKIRGIGTYASAQPTTGRGIRPAPYSTDFAVNNYTYGATNNTALAAPHGVGFVWATALWEVTWDLIDKYGFDADLYNGKGGNNMAMQLVIDGLKMQPCRPGFVDARNAILLADRQNNEGANQELIWKAFARRGLGFSASQGANTSRTDQVEAFDLPSAYACTTPLTVTAVQSSSVYTGGIATNLYLGYGPQSVMLQAGGDATNAYSWSPATGLSDAAIANPVFTPTAAGTYTFTVTAENADNCIKTKTITINVVDVRCGPKNNKVLVCHRGKVQCIDTKDVQSHLSHGDKLGDCNTVSATALASEVAAEKLPSTSITSYPNPFSESTNLSFTVKESGYTSLNVYDITGRVVATLFDGDATPGVTYTKVFKTNKLSGGIYIYRLVNGKSVQSGSLMVTK
ncbi:T9SS-dependent M36 family metallopeptidase [Pontibacter vulgaris]|uniref:T9SS-dependent M36 family metallopeptidase n=1 Tax=Pontibacter vulgaris TaxID=2905679 RepID=UPI001FA7AAC1|nr:T9SS-dependent M36 family metallopeptidase [Pontibacter vulgaris]